MKKNHFHPYMRPILRSYKRRSFLSKSKLMLDFLRKSALRNVLTAEDGHWIFIHGEKNHRKSKDPNWMPKLYVCVQSRDYWPVINDLLFLSKQFKFSWKFCKNFKTFGRPDKIIIYSQSSSDLKRILVILRQILKGRRFHKLRFASNTVESGLEKKGEGIFVGCDPSFLKTSWRHYRWLINECVIKNNKKTGLDQNTRKALRALNINLRHEGPLELGHPKKYNNFIKQIWKEINS